MKKILNILLILFLCTRFAHAQSYPTYGIGNLTVSGTQVNTGAATFNGAATFTSGLTGVIGAVTPNAGAFTTLSVTSAPTIGAAKFFPTVPNNGALIALSTATTSTVTRIGYNAVGDVPAITYTASASACSLNSGNGDNGDQVKSADNKCWLATFPPGPLDVREWGVIADSVTDNTNALQAAWNYGGTVGTNILLPPSSFSGYVLFSQLTAPAGSYANPGLSQNPLSGIIGRGIGQTVLYSSVTGSTCALTFNAPSSTYSRSAMDRVLGDFQLFAQTAGGGTAICLNQITGMELKNFNVQNFNIGVNAIDTITLRMDNPQFFANGNAIVANIGTQSYPNQWVIVNPLVGNSTKDAFLFYHPTDIDIYGGDFEGNNSANNTSYSTIHIQGNPIDGSKGLSVFGGYYEGNGGQSDFLINQLSGDAGGAHSIIGVTDNRISNTTYVTTPVALFNAGTGITRLDVHGVGFLNTGSYVASSSRDYIAVSAPASSNYRITGYDTNFYTAALESPWDCGTYSHCINLPDGHIEQWGTVTATSSGTAVTWSLACPNAFDSISLAAIGSNTIVSTGTTPTVTGTTIFTAAPSASVNWQILCH